MPFSYQFSMEKLLCLLLTIVVCESTAENPVVRTPLGPVEGVYLKSSDGRRFAAFRGIPYALPPVGQKRFEEPVPMLKWSGTWNATDYASACLQWDFTFDPSQEHVIGDEDCLFINVFTPKIAKSTSDLLNVVVYIHGGAFVYGASSLYGAKHLMDLDVVAVTFNYRLGVLGFLSTEDDVVPGNNGLKDQSLALKWISQNIQAFGGDPKKVTITGTSAGGASVHYHFLSPYSKGLFTGGMSFSGTALEPWAQNYKHREKAYKMGALVGCNLKSSQELIECLKSRPARKIVQQTEHFQVWRFNPFNPFGPIFPEPGKKPFLSKQPVELILNGEVQDLPWLTSITTAEGLYPAADFAAKDDQLRILDENFSDIAPYLLHFNHTVDNNLKETVSAKIRKYYFGDKPINSETRNELIQMVGDRTFVVDIERAARLMASVNKKPVYFYAFSHRGEESLSNFLSQTKIDMGTSHGDDAGYIMDAIYCSSDLTDKDRAVRKLMLNMVENFMKSGNPKPSKINFKWKPVDSESELLNYLSIPNDENLEMKSSSDLGNRRFWDSLPLQEPQRNVHVPAKKFADEL